MRTRTRGGLSANAGSTGTATTAKAASDSQRNYIRTLIDQIDWSEAPSSVKESTEKSVESDALTMTAASTIIDLLKEYRKSHTTLRTGRGDVVVTKEAPERQQRKGTPVTKPGVFETDEGIFIVKPTRDKERLYAKRLVESAPRLNAAGEGVDFDFEYAPSVIFRLTEEDRMPLERAKKLTIRYGRCIVCGRRLKAKQSVERGIGPICIKQFG